MTVYDAYLPVLVFASLLRDDASLHDTPFDTVRKDIETLFADAEHSLDAYVTQTPLFQDALLAAAAFVDEAVLTSGWQGKIEWLRQPLQRIYCNESNAGEEFYVRLKALLESMPAMARQSIAETVGTAGTVGTTETVGTAGTMRTAGTMGTTGAVTAGEELLVSAASPLPQPGNVWEEAVSLQGDVLALYAVSLTLGFKGLYHGAEQREHLRSLTLKSLSVSVAERIQLHETLITPQAYYMPAVPEKKLQNTWLSLFVWALIPALVTAGVYLAYGSIISAYAANWLRSLG